MFKEIILRIISYPFSFFIIYLGFQMIFDKLNYSYDFLRYKAVFSGVCLIMIALVYLISDIIMVFKKNKKGSN